VKVGDLIKLSDGPRTHFGLISESATLIKKLSRSDAYEYDWLVFVDGRCIKLGRQIENSLEVISERR
jgi:hypothetical protein